MSTIRDAQFHLRQLREQLVLAGVPPETHELAKKIERDLEKAFVEDSAEKSRFDRLQQKYDSLKAVRELKKPKPKRPNIFN